jgi:hypothetical protein
MHDCFDARFPERVTDGVQVDGTPILQADVDLEVNLPSLVHLCRRIGTFGLRLLPALATKARPLMQVAPNLRSTGQH